MQSTGYPLSLFVKTVIPQELFCTICKKVMRDPVNCLSCKIWLCLGCTTDACNTGNEKHEYSPINKFIKTKINDYEIKCRYSGQGCLKVAKIASIDKHEENCDFSKAKEKEKPIPGNSSQFNSTNCPTANYKCPTCKKQMLNTERKDHDCIKWLLEFWKILEQEVEELSVKNKGLLEQKVQKESSHSQFLQNSQNSKVFLVDDNEKKQKDIEELKKEIEQIKKTKEDKIAIKMADFYEFAENKNQRLQEKNEKEREVLFKKINNCTLDYLDTAKKCLFEFNCKVQADSTDLTAIPIDMKEYDKSPLRNFTNVGPASLYKK